MLPMLPLISIIIPFLQWNKALLRAVASAVSQDYLNKEILLVQDGRLESDISIDILERFNFSDIRIIMLSRNVGPGQARNVGIKFAKGEWISILDSDDEWHPHKLSLQINELQHYSLDAVSAVTTDCIVLSPDCVKTVSYGRDTSYVDLALGRQPAHSSLLFKKSFARRQRSYNRKFYLAEDCELYHRLLKSGKVVNVARYVTYYNKAEGTTSTRIIKGLSISQYALAAAIVHWRPTKKNGQSKSQHEEQAFGKVRDFSVCIQNRTMMELFSLVYKLYLMFMCRATRRIG
jgi:hypothetical protein